MSGINYKIQGKYDPSGENEAKSGIDGFARSAAGSINNFTNNIKHSTTGVASLCRSFAGIKTAIPAVAAIGAAVAVVAGTIKKVSAVINECTNEFSEAQLASTRFGMAVKNSTKLGADSYKNLTKAAEDFSKMSIYSADEIKAQEAYLAGLNLTEEQIKNTMSAAMDYSAFTGNDLKTSVEELAKTYSGASGKLGTLGAEFKDLTKAQLENGDAIKLVSERYKGYANEIANMTLAGKQAQWKKTADDIKQSFGEVFGTIKFNILGALQPVFDGLKEKIQTFNTGLINVFKNLPEVAQLTAQIVWEIFITLLKPSTWLKILKQLLEFIFNFVVDVWNGIANITVAIFKLVIDQITNLFKNLGLGIRAIFFDALNLIIDGINKVLGVYNKVAGALNWKQVNELKKFEEPKQLTDAGNTSATFSNDLKNVATQYFGMIQNEKVDVKNLGTDIAGDFKDATKESTDKLKEIIKKDNSKTVDKSNSTNTTSATTTPTTTEKTTTTETKNPFSGILDSLGELGKTIKLIMDSNPIGILVEVVEAFVSAFTSIENVNKSMNFLSTIFDSMKTVIEPLVNDVFSPFVVMFEDIGKMLGTILLPVFEIAKAILTPIMNVVLTIMNALQPILTVVVQLLNMIISLNPWLNKLALVFNFFGNCITLLYNKILVPVVNGIIWIFTSCLNFIIGIWNKCVSVLNSIEIMGWHPFDLDKKSGVNYDNLALKEIEAVTDSTTSTSSTSGSSGASYTASKDIVQNIYINDSYICGDAQKIALAIRAEIRQAEKLGY